MAQQPLNIKDYLERMKKVQTALLEFFDAENNKDAKFQKFIGALDYLEIRENSIELKSFFHLLVKFCKNHHRQPDFFKYIDSILTYFKDDITKNYSNSEIFTIFKGNNRLLLYLIKNKMIVIDQFVFSQMKTQKYSKYFAPEIKEYYNRDKNTEIPIQIPEDFENNRQLGENEAKICNLIRNDSINEFTEYVERTNFDLKKKIGKSDFETNSFLIDKNDTTLIQYAAFCGSLKIFKYLQKQKVEMKPSLWLYAIHGQNSEIIKILEKKNIKPEDKTYKSCLEESIKCQSNDLVGYLLSTYFKDAIITSIIPPSLILKYYNFNLMRKDFFNKSIFCDLCLYDYTIPVDILYKEGGIDINAKQSYIKLIQKKYRFLNNV